MYTERVEQLFSHVVDIPTLPLSVMRIMDMVDNSDCSVADVAKVLSSDPPLAAKVLKLANSSYYGFRQKISSIPQAAALLGLTTLKNTLLSASLIKVYAGGRTGLNLPALWTHSFAVATASKLIAKTVRFPNSEKAYAAGLLHDLGKIMIARNLRIEYAEIVKIMRHQGMSIGDAEFYVLRVDHADVGAWILHRWRIPNSIAEAVEHHHHPTRCRSNFDICGVVYLANILVHRSGMGSGGDSVIREVDPVVTRYFGLNENSLSTLLFHLEEKRSEITSLATVSAVG